MPLILALLLLTIIAGVVTWVALTGWLVRSGLEDLSRRRRLRRGADPVQLTAERAVDAARRSYLMALESLTETLDGWYALRPTLGIGTPLERTYPDLRDRTDADPGFVELVERANSASLANRANPPATVTELLAETARMDSLMLALRARIHHAGRSPETGPGDG